MKQLLPILALLLPLLLPNYAAAQSASILTLLPRPKAAFERTGEFTLTRNTPLFLSDHADEGTLQTMAWFQRKIRENIGDTLRVITANEFTGGPIISVGTLVGADSAVIYHLRGVMPPGELMPDSGGYILDISQNVVALIGSDTEGAFNGIATLVQLLNVSGDTATIRSAHILDYPDYPIRWVFSQHNLRGNNAITAIGNILDTMAACKLNGLQQNDFKYAILAEQPQYYFDSVTRFATMSAERNISIIPGVAGIGYSSGLLWHDPNLAEGFPASARYIVEGDTGRLVPDPRVSLPNGGFEDTDASGKFTGWSFYDGADNDSNVFVDRTIVHGGTSSARCTSFRTGDQATSGNCRFSRRVDCQPYRHYLLSAWVRTEDLDCDEVRLLAIGSDDGGKSRVLTFTAFPIGGTIQNWTKVEVAFNTLEFPHVQLYAGVWGGRSGTIWWDDFEIADGGLTNVLRRDGTPLTVTDVATGVFRTEGKDFRPVIDSIMEQSHGNYGPYHQAPTLRRTTDGAIRNGDTLLVSYYHPLTTVGDAQGNGSVMVCVSEDTLYTLLADEIRGVETIYHPSRYFLGHDEIRSMNHDSSCRARNLSPAQLLADNLTRCVSMVDSVHPGARTFVWSDMFDSLHNAVDDYYLIDGDLSGVWNLIPTSTTIVNWNGGKKRQSLEWFAGLGFDQITSPYYDVRNTTNMRAWRLAMEGISGMLGMMYTTWSADYTFLRPFSYYAWGAGPYIVHRPVDPTTIGTGDSIRIEALVLPDPYDGADAIDSVTTEIIVDGPPQRIDHVTLHRDTGDLFVGYITEGLGAGDFRYSIIARNRQGLTRTTPSYTVHLLSSAVSETERAHTSSSLALFPNPATTSVTVHLAIAAPGPWTFRIVDVLGRTVYARDGRMELPGERRLDIDLGELRSGSYRCVLRTGTEQQMQNMAIVK